MRVFIFILLFIQCFIGYSQMPGSNPKHIRIPIPSIGAGGADSLNQLLDVILSSPINGHILQYNGSNWVNTVIGGTGTVVSVGATSPAEGLTIANSPITVSGTFVFALANDLLGLEGLTTNGIGVRTGTSAWATRTLIAGTNIGITNANGVGGDITIDNTFAEVDALITNEGQLTVLAGAGTTSIIRSNTSGQTDITIEVGAGMTITELGNVITLNSIVSATTLDGLSDVAITSPINGQILQYNGSSWVNASIAGSGTVVSVGATAPSEGFTIANSPITVSGTFVFALANDLLGVEGLTGTGFAVRTAANTWANRTLVAGSNIGITNANGVSGNITIDNTFAEVDALITNEGQLTVLAGAGNTSIIRSNTSGQTDVTITAGSNMTITELGNVITLNAGSSAITGTGTTNFVTKWTSSSGIGNSLIQDNGSTVGIGVLDASYNFIVSSGNMKLGNATSGSLNKLYFGDGGFVYVGEDAADDRLFLRGSTLAIQAGGSVGTNGQVLTSNGTTASWAAVPGSSTNLSWGSITSGSANLLSSTGGGTILTAGSNMSFSGSSGNLTINSTGGGGGGSMSLSGGLVYTISGITGSLDFDSGSGVSLVFTGTSTNSILTFNATDALITNEGQLTVLTGAGNTSIIRSNTSGQTDVTITAGAGMTITELGNVITLNSTASATTLDGLSDVAITSPINGHVLQYNGSSWINTSIAGSGTVVSVGATAPSEGFTIANSPITTSGTFIFALANDLLGVEGLTGTGFAVRTAANTWANRTLVAGTNIGITNANGVSGNITIDNTFAEVDALITNEGQLTVGVGAGNTSIINSNTNGQTGVTITAGSNMTITELGNVITLNAITNTGTVVSVGAAAPSEGLTIANSPITTSGVLTFALANDLAGLEGLTGTGIGVRTGANTWANRTLLNGTNISITNANGVSGDITINSTFAEVDALITNEGQLTVAVGAGNTSIINSNTNGQTGVTITAGANMTITELGNVITLNAVGFGTGTVVSVGATAPSEGFTIANSPITTSGTFIFALANDLLGVEGLTGTGFAVRTAANTWANRTLVNGTNISITNANGVSGDITINSTFAEVDALITNEGQLTVQAGAGNTSIIRSNTSGQTDVTIQVGGINTISEPGSNTILITATEVPQVLGLVSNTLSLTGGGSSVSLASYLDNTDGQTLSLVSNSLSITGGNAVSLSPYQQSFSTTGLISTLSNSGGSIGFSNGSAITITNTGTSSNPVFNISSTATGTVTGSGTTNTIPKWTSSTALGNSIITDNGTNVSITGGSGFNVPLIFPSFGGGGFGGAILFINSSGQGTISNPASLSVDASGEELTGFLKIRGINTTHGSALFNIPASGGFMDRVQSVESLNGGTPASSTIFAQAVGASTITLPSGITGKFIYISNQTGSSLTVNAPSGGNINAQSSIVITVGKGGVFFYLTSNSVGFIGG